MRLDNGLVEQEGFADVFNFGNGAFEVEGFGENDFEDLEGRVELVRVREVTNGVKGE